MIDLSHKIKYSYKINYLTDFFFSFFTIYSDTVLLAGFYRSGTTYIMEYLGKVLSRRTYFEPLSFRVQESRQFHNASYQFFTSYGRVTEAIPYISHMAMTSNIDSFLKRMLRGKISTGFTRRGREKIFLRKNILIKLVRGNLIAGYIAQKFGCKSIIVIRHPCAILSSIIRNKGGAPDLRSVLLNTSFLQLILSQKDLLEQYFYDKMDVICKYKDDPVGAFCLSYCILNTVPLLQRKEISNLKVIYYENMVETPSTILADIACFTHDRIDYDYVDDRKSSGTTKEERRNMNKKEYAFGWKEELEKDLIGKVYRICSEFFDISILLDELEQLHRKD